MADLFVSLPIWLNGILFVCVGAAIWLSGTALSVYADEISDRKRIGKAFTGFVFLAGATSLPELVTTITASLANEAQLVLNNIFGGISMQTAILVVADAAVPIATLTFYPRKPTPVLEAVILIILMALLLAISFIGDQAIAWHFGIGAVFFAGAYFGSLALLRSYEENGAWRPVEVPEDEGGGFGTAKPAALEQRSTRRLVLFTIGFALVILVCGVAIVQLSSALAVQTGLGSSFIAVTLLATVTSLPELSTTIAAVRIGSFTMAISNIFGSNLLMLMMLLPADMLYMPGLILNQMDPIANMALVVGIVVTGVYAVGLLLRHKRRIFGMGVDSVLVLGVYLASLVIFYRLS
jgi:cation:H+ antiporter